MFNTLKGVATRNALLTTMLFAIAAPASAQAPTDAQKSAIRSSCRSDYQAHCASVTPGGAEALQCLEKNMSSLSAACQSAVRAVEPPPAAPKAEAAPPKAESAPAAPKAASAPATPAAAPAAKPAATAAPKAAAAKETSKETSKEPGATEVSAIKSACRSDYPKVCAGVPTGGAPALQCLEKNKAKLSRGCEKAVSAAAGGGAAATAAPAGTVPSAAAAAPAVIVLRPLLPREELFIVRSACSADIRTLCAGVAPGGGRIVQCISNRAASLSPACKDVLAPFVVR